MKERDHGLDVEPAQAIGESRIALEGSGVDFSPPRLDAAPGDREAEGVRADRGGERGVRLVTLPRAGGGPARLAASPSERLPLGPVARIAPLDLVMRHRHAPQTGTVGEWKAGEGVRLDRHPSSARRIVRFSNVAIFR